LNSESTFTPKEPNFRIFLTSLSLQVAIALGRLENPVTHKYERNIPQAEFLIKTLKMLAEKTKGNLTSEEENLLQNILSELNIQLKTVS
jgi:hypothetical protein